MPYIFNDLSLNSRIDTPDKFIVKIKEILNFARICGKYAHVFYLHQNGIYNSAPCNINFRSCLNNIGEKELKSRVLSLIDKNTPSLPEESAIPDGLYFYYNNEKIPCTGLAECAYQNFMGEVSHCFSLSAGGYDMEQLSVIIRDNDSTNIQELENVYSLERLENICEHSQGCIPSWEEMIRRAGLLNLIRIEDYVLKALEREPFSSSLAEAILVRLKALSNIISAENDTAFNELFKRHCTGGKAHFSEESKTNIRDYEDKLTFTVRKEGKLCSYHGKITSDRQFRIHMDERPSRGNERTIVYIGYKITRS